MAKPFSIQSPEEIAKEYGGNKQKIGEAMQMGIVDPTAGVLAGMFIDRMRAAQMQEQTPQTTVAQQVMGGVPASMAQVPPAAMPATPAGLGAIAPQGGEAMPEMPAPEMAAPEEAPMGMAMGGIASLDVPDEMFDEPTNGGYDDGYAGGGLVAFARGGETDLEAFRRAIIQQESGGRYGVANRQGSGAMGIGQIMPDTARALAKRLGLPYDPKLLSGTSDEAKQYQDALTAEATREAWEFGGGDPKAAAAYYFAGPNKKGWGEKTSKYQSDIMRRLGLDTGEGTSGQTPGQTSGGPISFDAVMDMLDKRFAPSEEEKATNEALRARAKEMASPEYYEKQRKEDMWSTLAEIGFNMASTKSPSLLQAIGEAASAALPGAEASKKERKALKDRALNLMVELGAKDRKDAMEKFKMATDVWQTNLSASQFEKKLASEESQFQRKMALSEQELQLGREKLDAEIAAAKNKGIDVDTAVFQMMISGDPAAKAAAKEYLGARYPSSGGAMTPDAIRKLQEGRTGGGGFMEGQTSKDTNGNTIVFQGGQWVYP